MDWALLKPRFNLVSYRNAIHPRDEVIIPSKVSAELSVLVSNYLGMIEYGERIDCANPGFSDHMRFIFARLWASERLCITHSTR